MKKIKVPIYGGYLVIDVGPLKETVEKYNVDVDPSSYNALTINWIKDGVRHTAILVEKGASPGIIAHESKHTVNSIFKSVGMKLDEYNDEAECYLLGWVVNRVHEAIKKYDNTLQ